jgi:hypothetical protein
MALHVNKAAAKTLTKNGFPPECRPWNSTQNEPTCISAEKKFRQNCSFVRSRVPLDGTSFFARFVGNVLNDRDLFRQHRTVIELTAGT